MNPEHTPRVLAIAGSDSGGGAGIQADLKAFAAAGVHGMTAITAITAQSTVAVEAVEVISPAMIVAQVRAVAADIGVDAVKIGMLGDVATIAAVEEALDVLAPRTPIVVDPVMVAESGGRLLQEAAVDALRERILPRATVVTPNLPEALVLAGASPAASSAGAGASPAASSAGAAVSSAPAGSASATGRDHAHDAERLARAVRALGPQVVVVTGGHRDEATDLFFDGVQLQAISGERHPDGAAHGSGCTHASTLAAHLALGATPLQAAREARRVTAEAVGRGLRDIGAGAGPVDVLGIKNRRDIASPLT